MTPTPLKDTQEMKSKCCNAPIITRGDTEKRGSTCWYECSKCHEPCDEKQTSKGKCSCGGMATVTSGIKSFCGDCKKEKMIRCNHCGGDISIRNPSGFCDHLYFPDRCDVCSDRLPELKKSTIWEEYNQIIKSKLRIHNDAHKKGYDSAKKSILIDLKQIVKRNEWMGGYDYDGIAEGLLIYLKIIK